MNEVTKTTTATPAPATGEVVKWNPGVGAEHVAQTTAIEQSRAVAEVQAAAIMARQFPRSETVSRDRIISACSRLALAERAFFKYERGGEDVTGGSIYLARELARCWGNIQYEIVELAQDRQRGESEAMAYALDLETNTRAAIRFIVPHWRDTKSGGYRLKTARDIYELVANNGSRRLRQCIFSVIPDDIVQEAKARCKETMKNGDGKPLAQRIKDSLVAFAALGVTREMVKGYIGAEPEKMSADQLFDLRIIYQSIREGEPAEAFFGEAKAQAPAVTAQHGPAAAPAAQPQATAATPTTAPQNAQAAPAAAQATQAAPAKTEAPARGRPSKAEVEAANAEGARAFHAGETLEACPEERPSIQDAWRTGWQGEADKAAKPKPEAQPTAPAAEPPSAANGEPPFDVDAPAPGTVAAKPAADEFSFDD